MINLLKTTPILSVISVLSCCSPPPTNTIDEARLLKESGEFSQSLMIYEELIAQDASVSTDIIHEYAEVSILAAQLERTPYYRNAALTAVSLLDERPGDIDGRIVGELWRRLGWEMERSSDSLQAFHCFDNAILCGADNTFEDEWLFRGTWAASHLGYLTEIPDTLEGTPSADSLITLTAEKYLVELDRIPLTRTDIRSGILTARLKLLPFTMRRQDEMQALTELDRIGTITPELRHHRIELLVELAEVDMNENRNTQAREKLLEVWHSNFAGEKIHSAYLLGRLAEMNGNPEEALGWYRNACSVSPTSTSEFAMLAEMKRDSLLYSGPID